MTTAQQMVDRVRKTLIDADKDTWSDPSLLEGLNAGIAQACGTLLDIYVVTQIQALVAGVRQSLPTGGLVLIDIPRNGAGTVVEQVDQVEFGRTRPDWPSETASAAPRYWMQDRRNPARFMVSPPATSGATAELVFGSTPAALALGETIPLSTAFDTSLWAYTLGVAYAQNTVRQDLAKSAQFMGMASSIWDTWKKGADTTVRVVDARR
ncbi:DUF6682 family protein [Piscinibacter sakaiensis]|uniref:Phage protein n=1 Tax=Piscinibacter sakaiensis TaxID=1547922 RepID=A0A0K8P5A9_PISS1|nr:DUF6682 family protein [Piscinibacter sakaiensis]GAP37390.1 hypothetical protein ISF6_3245 [Piscinibacter sakaiensis]